MNNLQDTKIVKEINQEAEINQTHQEINEDHYQKINIKKGILNQDHQEDLGLKKDITNLLRNKKSSKKDQYHHLLSQVLHQHLLFLKRKRKKKRKVFLIGLRKDLKLQTKILEEIIINLVIMIEKNRDIMREIEIRRDIEKVIGVEIGRDNNIEKEMIEEIIMSRNQQIGLVDLVEYFTLIIIKILKFNRFQKNNELT